MTLHQNGYRLLEKVDEFVSRFMCRRTDRNSKDKRIAIRKVITYPSRFLHIKSIDTQV